jgi:hypothetical protein
MNILGTRMEASFPLSWNGVRQLGPALATPTLAAPCVAPPALDTLGTGATIGRCEPGVTSARSPTLTIDDAIKVRHGGIARCAVDQRMTRTNE